MKEKQINYWKWAFLTILAILLLLGVYMYIMLQPIQTGEVNTEPTTVQDSELTFEMSSGKEDLTQLVNTYLDSETQNDFIGYTFNLNDQAELHGQLNALGVPIQFSLHLEPEVLDNGNLLLHAEEISVGSLNLPISFVLSQIANQVEFPEFIEINSEENWVAVNLNEFQLENGTQFSVSEMNLSQDDIGINIHLPIEAIQ